MIDIAWCLQYMSFFCYNENSCWVKRMKSVLYHYQAIVDPDFAVKEKKDRG